MEEENFHLENLDLIQEALENSIAAYAIQNEEDLFDEENHNLICFNDASAKSPASGVIILVYHR